MCSELQLRSRLKKWHITKPSRKKYDGSRRLSGAKKNAQAQKPQTLPSSYHTLPSQPHESDESRSEASRPSVSVSVPEMSISPANRYVLPSSPHDELPPALYGSNIVPSTPLTPAVYGMDEKRHDPHPQTIYYYPQSPSTFPAHVPSYPTMPYTDPALSTEYLGYNPYLPSNPLKETEYVPELPPPLLESQTGSGSGSLAGSGPGPSSSSGSGSGSGWVGYQPPSPSVYTRPLSYFHDDGLHSLAPPIYQAM